MKCDVCKKQTDKTTTIDNKTMCLKCYMAYLKWQITRGNLDKSTDTYIRKYGTSG